jgi:hypothetical protein
MHTPESILHELLTEEILRLYVFDSLYVDNDDLEKACQNFVYIHDISALKMDEDLTEDFETSGHISYNLNAKSNLFLQVTFNYCDGDLSDIEYIIRNNEMFKGLIDYAVDTISKILKKKVNDFLF